MYDYASILLIYSCFVLANFEGFELGAYNFGVWVFDKIGGFVGSGRATKLGLGLEVFILYFFG